MLPDAATVTDGVVDVWTAVGTLHAGEPPHADDVANARRFRTERGRTRFFARRSVLRSILSRYLRLRPDQVPLLVDPGGMPYVAVAPDTRLWCNVSDAGDLVVVAVAAAPVGIDVERIDATRVDDDVALRFFSRAERRHLGRLRGADRVEGFFACWTMKEALAKATGLGLSLPLTHLDLAPRGPARSSAVVAALGAEDETRWSVWPIDLGHEHAAAVAVEGLLVDVRVRAV